MSSAILFCVLAFVFAPFFEISTTFYVQALPKPRGLPPISSVASRGTTRQILAFLAAHNAIRAEYKVPDLIWSRSLADKAVFWADKCLFKHSDGVLSSTPYGENVAAATGDFSITDAFATFISDKGKWFAVEKTLFHLRHLIDKYDPSHPSYLRFTQVVWKSTTEVGCAVSQCNSLFNQNVGPAMMYVCLYNPAGNVVGQIK